MIDLERLYQASSAEDVRVAIEAAVREGRLHPGDRIPSVRSAARGSGLSPATVAAAYRELGRRGVTMAAGGRGGTVIAPHPPLGGHTGPRPRRGQRDLASGHPDPALLPEWGDLLGALPRRSLQYGAPTLDPDLADLARRRLRADGVDATHLTVVSGAMDGVERVLAARLRPGDPVAVEDPCYHGSLDLLRAMSFRLLPVTVDARGMLPSALEQALARGARAVLITPRSQNPFGSSLDGARRAELRAALDAHPETLVIEDDHAEAVGGGSVIGVAPPGWPSWAVIRSVSKSLGPDLRVAAVCGDATTVARVEGRMAVGPGWVSHLLQRLVAGLWSRPGIDAVLAGAADVYARRRRALIGALERRGVTAHGRTGFNVWVPVPEETAAFVALWEAGYDVQAGERFRLLAPPAIRITCARLDVSEADAVAEAVARTAEYAGRVAY